VRKLLFISLVGVPALLVDAATPSASAEGAPTDTLLRLVVDLQDGSRLVGKTQPNEFRLRSGDTEAKIDLARVRRLRVDPVETVVMCTMRDGTELRGVPDLDAFEAVTLLGLLKVPLSSVRQISITPPIRIAGSGETPWNWSLINAKGWDLDNEEGALTVTAIEPRTVARGNEGKWSSVKLWRGVDGVQDFTLGYDFSWWGPGREAMQSLFIKLLNSRGAVIASGGYTDAWGAHSGSRYSEISGKPLKSRLNTLPVSGSATITITRSDGAIRVLWDDKVIQSGSNSDPVARMELWFGFYAWASWGKSVFGQETVHRLELRSRDR